MTYQITSSSVDEQLGPRVGRYFGEGYKRVGHRLSRVHIVPAPERGAVQATVSLEYPQDWSTKATAATLRPHLSSVDALLIAVQLAEMYLLHAYSLTPDQRQRMWLRRVEVKAGNAPQEQLDAVPVRAVNTSMRPANLGLCSAVSTFSCIVGALRVSCDIEHDLTRTVLDPIHVPIAEQMLGDPDSRQFGKAYRGRSQFIGGIEVDPAGQQVEALVSVVAQPASLVADPGLGGSYQPSLSMIDGLVTLAQLAQVIAYRMDGLTRAQSNTMWMRRLTLNATTPFQPMKLPFVSSVAVESSNQLRMNDRAWRTVDAVGHFLGIDARCAFAHQLPTSPAQRPMRARIGQSCTNINRERS